MRKVINPGGDESCQGCIFDDHGKCRFPDDQETVVDGWNTRGCVQFGGPITEDSNISPLDNEARNYYIYVDSLDLNKDTTVI